MVHIYEQHNGELIEIQKFSDQSWINLTGPTHNELHQVSETFNIPMELLTAALDPEERSRYETDEGVLSLIIRIPIANDEEVESGIPYITRPLGMLIKNDVFITICTRENSVIFDFVTEKVKNFSIQAKHRFVLQIFYRSVLKYLRFLKDIDNQTNDVEKELTQALKNSELIRLLNYEKSLVYFNTSLKSNQIVMERLKRTSFFRQAVHEDRELLEDIIIDNTQAIEMANIYTNILSGLMDTFASVISNNLNNVMRTLTKITIALMLPTLLASFLGMNMNLPNFVQGQYGFEIVIILCALLSLLSMALLNSKKWF